jgi:hypothetical protein
MGEDLMAAVRIPLVSVILPVFNAERYVGAAIQSILGQTLSDFELIVIDDGSTDASLKRVAALSDPRVRVLVNPGNLGLVRTLNRGVDTARGRFVARMDADDVAHSRRLERQVQHLDSTGADVCGTWIRFFGAENRVVRYPASHDGICLRMLFETPMAHPTVLARRELLCGAPYDPAFLHAEDYELWSRLIRQGARLANLSEVLLDYRVHSLQVSSAQRPEQLQCADRIAAEFASAFIPDDSEQLAALGGLRRSRYSEAAFQGIVELLLRATAAHDLTGEDFADFFLAFYRRVSPMNLSTFQWFRKALAHHGRPLSWRTVVALSVRAATAGRRRLVEAGHAEHSKSRIRSRRQRQRK